MPAPYSNQHHQYIANYISSGRAKVVGKGTRTVVAQRKVVS